MGRLVEGRWDPAARGTSDKAGYFKRQPRTFRHSISRSGGPFPAASGRYHLYVSYACPWAHRTLIFRRLKELEDHISVSVVHPDMLDNGWTFGTDFPGSTGDHLFDEPYLYRIYQRADPDAHTSVTVPVLWDRESAAIVNNESSEIIRMLNSAFDSITGNRLDLYPEELREEIDVLNERVYHTVNNGVYRAGFARTQSAHDRAVDELFATLDLLEERLAGSDWLVGERMTEADIRLLTTLLRFDIVYEMATTRFDHIKRHYFYSHGRLNPGRLIPRGPDVYL